MVSNEDLIDDDGMEVEDSSQTVMDSHSNMLVLYRHVYVISYLEHIADVNPFLPDYNSIKVPIVDAGFQYDLPTMKGNIPW